MYIYLILLLINTFSSIILRKLTQLWYYNNFFHQIFILVRAYLLSYLSNLQTTADENKLNQKRFYEGINTISSKKSLNDILRYSRKLEYYHQSPLLHSGVLLDADIIYSYK